MNGTSMACPAVAAAGALIRQYFTEGWYPTGTREPANALTKPSGALLKATLLNATIDMSGLSNYGGMTEGFGLLDLQKTLFFQAAPSGTRRLRVWDTPNAQGFLGGDAARTQTISVATDAEPLKVTLVWTEPPQAVGAALAITNDLDLTVTSPDGMKVFRPNAFVNGFSQAGAAGSNGDNVEMIWINKPAAGNWTITVTPVMVSVGNPGQGYALVATGDLTP